MESNIMVDDFALNSEPVTITYFTAWLVPGVALYAVTYMCVKSSNYGLLFWLPLFLDNHNLSKQSSFIASMYDIGTWAGGLLTGIVSDRIGKRAILMAPMLFLSAICMLIVKLFLD